MFSGRQLQANRESIAADEYKAARQWVGRRTSALRDAARTEWQDYHSSFGFREIELEGRYRARQQELFAMVGSRYEQQMKDVRNHWEQQHVAILQSYRGEADGFRS